MRCPQDSEEDSPAFAFPHAYSVSAYPSSNGYCTVTELSVRSHLNPVLVAKGLAAATQAVVQRLMGENPDVTLDDDRRGYGCCGAWSRCGAGLVSPPEVWEYFDLERLAD